MAQLSKMENWDRWTVRETRLRLLGRCYTFRYSEAVPALSFDAQLVLRGDVAVYLALHEPGEQLWFSEGAVPNSIPMHSLDPKVKEKNVDIASVVNAVCLCSRMAPLE